MEVISKYFFHPILDQKKVTSHGHFLLDRQLGFMCCIYNAALDGSIDNGSCKCKNGQIYINGILTPENIDEYIPMDKNICRAYRPPLLMYGIKA